MNPTSTDTPARELERCMQRSVEAFEHYRHWSLEDRNRLLHAIAGELELQADALVAQAARDSHLPEPRLRGELARTVFQLRSYGDACQAGQWLDARIDRGDPKREPLPKPDLRKMLVALGPVVVFGASNFPFAYSTAGGDTACALAAGCSVVVKAHPAHLGTSDLVAACILRAAESLGAPEGLFQHVHGASTATGAFLVEHPLTRAVGFTGSLAGGRALFDLAARRTVPIPVFAEMGSVNPVVLLSGRLNRNPEALARQYAASITQNMGQFCTNPGLLVAEQGAGLDAFLRELRAQIRRVAPAEMLHAGIAAAFHRSRSEILALKGVQVEAVTEAAPVSDLQGLPTLCSADAATFMQRSRLHEELFGPYSLLVRCQNPADVLQVLQELGGQLTCTLLADPEDLKRAPGLWDRCQQLAGRLILQGVPTGVEVCVSMQHGGPYPATTDSRFTSVGADGIRRFARPLCFQDAPQELLPEALMDTNPLGIYRTVDGVLSRDPLPSLSSANT